jgi:tetratricopeptide (TPR) repeat protein
MYMDTMTKAMRFGPVLIFAATLVAAAGGEFERARKAYSLTEFDQSLKVLLAIPEKDAAIYELTGRNFYMLGDYKKATEALDKAAAADPESGEIALWLGRAYGRRAETSSPFTAPGHASKARQWFEKAVELSPKNLEALSDLFEYYLEAPGFLGGGLDKAQAIAARMGTLDPAEGHWAAAKLAEKRKEFSSAEEQLRRAIDASPQRVGRILDLAKFLARQGRFQEADQSFARAEKVAPNSPRIVYAKADVYIKTGRNLELAKNLLKRYMTMKLSPEDPTRVDAAKLLKQVEKAG